MEGRLAMVFGFDNTEMMAVAPAMLVLLLLLVGLARGYKESGLAAGPRTPAVWIAALAIVGWFVAAAVLASAGWLAKQIFGVVPTIAFGVLVPVAAGTWAIMRSSTVGAMLAATPQSMLVGVQAYRALGLIFLALWLSGMLPAEFAIPAGIGDVAVGIGAVWLGLSLTATAAGRKSILWWNVLGLTDLGVALVMGTLTSPSRLQLLALDAPNTLIAVYPLAMIPVFSVPASIVLHIASLTKLRREHGGWVAT